MNIQKVAINRMLKQYGIFFAGIGFAIAGQHAYEKAVINNTKAEIMVKYPDKYKEINKNATNLPFVSAKDYWTSALAELEDSATRVVGAAKKAYFEGINKVKNNIVTIEK